MRIIDHLVVMFLLISFGYGCYNAGSMSEKKPVSELIWIDNNRIHKDSTITTKPIYGEPGEQIGCWIKASYQNENIFIECLDKEGYTWEEWRDSWIMAFKGGSDE